MQTVKPPTFEVRSAEFVYAARRPAELPPPTKLEIAFVGRSNVGKSSMLNKLLNRRGLARTSSTPGCTRQINFFDIKSATGLELMLVDLPGYGYASRSKGEREEWAQLIEHYLLERSTLRAAAVLFDSRRGIEKDETDVLELITEHGKVSRRVPEVVLVATKVDKLPARDRPKLQNLRLDSRRVIPFSVDEPDATQAVWRALLKAAELV
ncbi:MAG TPA: ribosome biogenesis GTP-binding protein YihA/YsxC [Polyangiaceae bacterium]|nr:ribosome biogenesis GTP-binding protein YihA/YsxC [Polyangiaceae bacterium]